MKFNTHIRRILLSAMHQREVEFCSPSLEYPFCMRSPFRPIDYIVIGIEQNLYKGHEDVSLPRPGPDLGGGGKLGPLQKNSKINYCLRKHKNTF